VSASVCRYIWARGLTLPVGTGRLPRSTRLRSQTNLRTRRHCPTQQSRKALSHRRIPHLAMPPIPRGDGDGGDHQAGDRVGPSPAQGGVEDQAHQEHCGEVGAQQCLGGVGDHGVRPECVAGAALREGQEGHDHQRRRCKGNAHRGGVGLVPAHQGTGRLDGHVDRKSEERDRHQAQRLPLPGLRQPEPELPQDDQPAADLNDRVQAEPDQGHRAGDHAGGDGDDRLQQVVGHRHRRQHLTTAAEPAPTLRVRHERRGVGVRAHRPAPSP